MRSRGAISGVDPEGACLTVGPRRRECSCGELGGNRAGWRRLAGKGKRGKGRKQREAKEHFPGENVCFAPFWFCWSLEFTKAESNAGTLNKQCCFITKKRHWIPEITPIGLHHVEEHEWLKLEFQCSKMLDRMC